MKISIVTVTFNSAATLGDTLESVLRQQVPAGVSVEHIIKDGGSTDATMELVRSIEPRYRERFGEGSLHWVSEPDGGIYDAMNRGIALATGDVVGILNSDDMYYDHSVLEHIANAMKGDGADAIDCVYGDLVFVDAADTSMVVRTWKSSQYRKGAFMKGWHPAHPTFYARRELFKRFGDFDTSFSVSADFELMLRIIEKEGARNRYVPYTLVRMRVGGESTGSISSIIEGNRNVLRAFRKNGLRVPRFYLVRRLAPKAWDMLKCKLGFVAQN